MTAPIRLASEIPTALEGFSLCQCCLEFVTPSNLNSVKASTGTDILTIDVISGLLSARAIQNIPDMLGYLQ